MNKKTNNDIWKKLGAGYRRLRLKRGTIHEDAIHCGLSTRHYQQLETGKSHTLTTLYKLAAMFNVKASMLLKGILK